MAKKYFQDITPGGDEAPRKISIHAEGRERLAPRDEVPEARGIRSVNIPHRGRPSMTEGRPPLPPPPRRSSGRSRVWLWVLCALCVLALLTLLIVFVFRYTSVTIVPQSQVVTFDNTSQFTAYPAATAADGTIPYTVQSTDLKSSESVASSGTQDVETKASGEITIVNNYSSSPLHFVASTRFQTSGGLIFRAPAAVSVPGKESSTPGKVTITVAADAVGQNYNIGPQSKLTIPGLQSSLSEYASVYAYSTASTTGGFSGNQPGVAPSDLDTAKAKLEADLQQQATTFANSLKTASTTVLTLQVTYTDEPNTPGSGNSVGINESAHVDVILVPSDVFASAVSQGVLAGAAAGAVELSPQSDFAVNIADASSTWGMDPLSFTLAGHGMLVWTVNTGALAQALAGRDQGAFETIVATFPGIQSAHARIEPFWENHFPSNPADIHITVQQPQSTQSS